MKFVVLFVILALTGALGDNDSTIPTTVTPTTPTNGGSTESSTSPQTTSSADVEDPELKKINDEYTHKSQDLIASLESIAYSRPHLHQLVEQLRSISKLDVKFITLKLKTYFYLVNYDSERIELERKLQNLISLLENCSSSVKQTDGYELVIKQLKRAIYTSNDTKSATLLQHVGTSCYYIP